MTPTHPTDRPPLARWCADALGCLAYGVVALTLAWYVPANHHLQWDLHAYALAAKAAVTGLDPYRLDVLATLAGRRWDLPFLYPPVTLPLFAPMAWLPFPLLASVWMTLKLGALVALVAIGRRWFAVTSAPATIALVMLFGFDGAALFDLRTGNVAMFETLLVWTGLALWRHGRMHGAALCIVLASLFKLTPIAFLALLLLPDATGRRRGIAFGVALASFAAAIVLPAFVGPAAPWHPLTAALHAPHPAAADDPGALALITTLPVLAYVPFPDPALALWCVYAAVVAGLALLWWRRGAPTWDAGTRACAAAMVWMLLAPRPMCYGYVMAVIPALTLAPRALRSGTGTVALALLLSAQAGFRLMGYPPATPWAEQLPFLTLLALWLLRVAEDLASGRTAPAGVLEPAPAAAA